MDAKQTLPSVDEAGAFMAAVSSDGDIRSNLTPLIEVMLSLVFVFMIGHSVSIPPDRLRLADQDGARQEDEAEQAFVYLARDGALLQTPGQSEVRRFESIAALVSALGRGGSVEIFSAKQVPAGSIFSARDALLAKGVTVKGVGPWIERRRTQAASEDR